MKQSTQLEFQWIPIKDEADEGSGLEILSPMLYPTLTPKLKSVKKCCETYKLGTTHLPFQIGLGSSHESLVCFLSVGDSEEVEILRVNERRQLVRGMSISASLSGRRKKKSKLEKSTRDFKNEPMTFESKIINSLLP